MTSDSESSSRTLREKVDPVNVRAAWWTVRALRSTRSRLREGMVEGVRVPAPPRLPARGIHGVLGAMRRVDHTCLERSLVLQRWHRAHGRDLDVVVGVTAPHSGFAAHAWLDGDPEADAHEFEELLRLPAR